MSLKSNLKAGPLKEFMKAHFGNLKPFVRDVETGEPADWSSPITFPYVKAEKYFLLGTAYDIYIRSTLARKTKDDAFLEGLFVFLNHMKNSSLYAVHHGIDAPFVESFKSSFLKNIHSTEPLQLLSIIELSIYEDMVRSSDSKVEHYTFPTEEQFLEIKTELENFIAHSNTRLFAFLEGEQTRHGKSFGRFSRFLGGADLDLITEDAIIELKTNKELSYQSKDWYQVVCYAMLNQLFEPATDVDKVLVYYARFDRLFYIDLDEISVFNKVHRFRELLYTLE